MITHVVAKTLVYDADGNVLLLVRSNDDVYRAGKFDLPGGQVDDGEEILVGAAREIQEETGLTVDPLSMQLVYAHTGTRFSVEANHEVNLVRLYFVVSKPDSEIRLSHEHTDFRWFPLEEAITQTDHERHQALMRYVLDHQLIAAEER